ncbi:MAG: saccharopine dehydrogenase NADP-binding domain-containing protein [Elusimicrobiota bacterium]|nr:MAG: saccharopine dehydrogenase NADP-binding domain-containing protein [Elusimicrobiota bacterium]
MRFLILGSGFQGRACAYDMLRNPAVTEVALCDMSAANLASAKKFLAKVSNGRAKFKRLDASKPAAVQKALKGYSALVSCVPYFLNLPLAKAAIAARVHYVDLGGNTDIVKKEIALHPLAVKAGVSILPDNGLGPGMISTLAVHAMSMLDRADEVLIRDGGLPQKPVAPMNYMLTFSEHGLINEYVAPATALRKGKVVSIPGLSETELIDVPSIGRCEAAHAAGGLSTLAETYAGKVQTMDNKLIRYPGHIAVINAMTAMGFFDDKPREVRKGVKVAPRELAAKLFREHFHRPGDEDMVVIHNTVRGIKDGRPAEIVHSLVDRGDKANGMTAMMRTTGFPASIVAQMAADGRGRIKPGAYPVELGVPPEPFIDEARKRGFDLTWKFRWLDGAASEAAAIATAV